MNFERKFPASLLRQLSAAVCRKRSADLQGWLRVSNGDNPRSPRRHVPLGKTIPQGRER
jgi:hypothetical protein